MDYVTNENPAALLHINKYASIPDYVISSNRVTKEEVDQLNTAAFADPFNREYPCHTKAACWQAAVDAVAQGKPQTVVDGILKLASVHGCREDCEAAIAVLKQAEEPQQEKQASAEDSRYALTVDYTGVPEFAHRGVENYYPIDTPYEVSIASQDIMRDYNASKLPLPAMRKAANTVMQRAEELDMDERDIDVTVRRVGSLATPDMDASDFVLSLRKEAGVKDLDAYRTELESMRGQVARAGSAEEAIEIAEKAASAIWQLDLENNVQYHSTKQPDPFSLIFTGPTTTELKKAAAASFALCGVRVPVLELSNMSETSVRRHFSKEAAAIILNAREAVQGEPSLEKSATASQTLSVLPEEVQAVLLSKLVDTAWEN